MHKIFILICTYLCTINLSAQDIKRPDSYNYSRGLEALQKENTEEALDYFNKEINDNPKNGYAFVWIAMLRDYQQEYGRALTAVDRAIKLLPKKDKEYRCFAYKTRASIYTNLEQVEKALQDYSSAIKEEPENEDVYEKRAQLYFSQNDFALADNDYKHLIELNQGSVMGYMGIGRNANAQKNYKEAITQFDYVVKLAPDYSSGYSFRAESYAGLKQYSQAADDVIKALSIDGDEKAFRWMQQIADSSFNDMSTKLKVQTLKNPSNYYWKYCQGVIYERSEQYRKALSCYKSSYSLDASSTTAYRICKCYNELGDYDMAIKYINRAIETDSISYVYISTRAEVLDHAGRTGEAICDMTSIIEQYPDFYGGYYHRGWMRDHTGNTQGAIEDYSIAISLEPNYAYAYLNRGSLYRILGNDELSRLDYEKVIQLDTIPGDNNCAHYAFYYLGYKDKAIDFMDRALAIDDKGNYYDAACLYSIMGETEKAISYLGKALVSGFRRFAHIDRDRDLNNIRETESFKSLIKEYKLKHKFEVENHENASQQYHEEFTEIPFVKRGGVFEVKCTINNLPLHFIFDTGASDVSISNVEAAFMMKNGYLTESDVVGRQTFLNASGEISEGTIVNLKSVVFGGLHLDNIKASVVKNQSAPLLLGQTVFNRLGKIEIDNSKQVIKITYKKKL